MGADVGDDVGDDPEDTQGDTPDPDVDAGDTSDADAGPCECDDGDPCNGVETCDEQTGDCVAGEPVICSDENPCNGVESCNSDTGECEAGEAVVCADDDLCDGQETCDPETGQCVDGTPVECGDDDLCNGVESCNPETGICEAGDPVICDDAMACNGVERCDPGTGLCLDGEPVVCTNGDPCDGIETCDPDSGDCVPELAPACPTAPSACGQNGGEGGHVDGRITRATSAAFRLLDNGTTAEKNALIDRLERHADVTPVSLTSILSGDLNRTGSRISVSGLGCFHDGFKWNEGDNEVDYWWPQGVTGSSDRDSDGLYSDRRVMLVSWYHKHTEDGNADFPKGVRISIVDHSNLGSLRYRHALLAEPVEEDGRVTLAPISNRNDSVHAGGIVWAGDYLYIADTGVGLRVFDMSRILQVNTGERNKLGYDEGDDTYYAYNYRYVIPQVARMRLCEGGCCARFSWLSLDRTSDPIRLVAGEYVSDADTGRFHTWPVREDGALWTVEGAVESTETYFAGVRKMQGGAILNGRFYISSSSPNIGRPPSPGSFYYAGGVDRNVSQRRYPFLPEDLYYRPQTDELWTCTEYPAGIRGQTRYCFSVQTADVQGGCD